MVIVDAHDEVVFESATADSFSENKWGIGLSTLQWISGRQVLRCTRRLSPPPWDPAHANDEYIAPEHGELDARTYSRAPRGVRSISVAVTESESAAITPPGPIVLTCGYNVDMTVGAPKRNDGGRLVTQIFMRARPGNGAGRVPGCGDAVTVLRRINSATPDGGGNITLDMTDCYRLQRPAAIGGTPRQGTISNLYGLEIFNDCAPCCSCTDFINTYKALQRQNTAIVKVAGQANATSTDLQLAIDRWNAQAACRLQQPLRLVAMTDPMCTIFVGGSYCNMSHGCLTPMFMRVTFETFRGGVATPFAPSAVTPYCREGFRNGTDTDFADKPYTPQGPYPVLDTPYDTANPQASSIMRTRFRFTGCTSIDTVRITLTAHSPDAVDPVTGEIYTLPVASVPSGVTALWTARGRTPAYPARASLVRVLPLDPTSPVNC
jgi:hypothetical protein